MTACFMRSCGASLMRMEGTANGGEYEKDGRRGGVERRRRKGAELRRRLVTDFLPLRW